MIARVPQRLVRMCDCSNGTPTTVAVSGPVDGTVRMARQTQQPERAAPPPLIHLHIPKNGGTTLSRTLKLHTLAWPPSHWIAPRIVLGHYDVAHGEPRMASIANLPVGQRRRVRFFEAHRGYGMHHRMGIEARYVTMLREPIERTLSVYRYIGERAPDGDMAGFIHWASGPRKDGRANVWYVDNAQVRYLAAENGGIIDVPAGEVTRDMLNRAKQRVDETLDWVLLLERFDESMVLLKHALNWRGCYYLASNVNRSRRANVEQQTLDCIRGYNELDLELYEHAKSRFERDLAAIPGLSHQLARYRRRNRLFSRLARPLYAVLPYTRPLVRRLR